MSLATGHLPDAVEKPVGVLPRRRRVMTRTRPRCIFTALNAEITRIVARQAELREQIDAIVAEIEEVSA
jgi:hypothetical protein